MHECGYGQGKEKGESLLFGYFNEIGIIAQSANNEFARSLPDGLTVFHFSVLNWFGRVDSEATPGRLADAFQVTAGAMTNTLKNLAQKDSSDWSLMPASSGRRKRVTLTREGRVMRDLAIARTSPLLAEFGQVMNAMNFERQLKQLRKVRAYFDARRST